MAELLLDERARHALAEMLKDQPCPRGVNLQAFQTWQRGGRRAIGFRSMAAIAGERRRRVRQGGRSV